MSRRTDQVSNQILQILAEAISTRMRDPRLGFVTLTRCTVTPDLKYAKIYFSVLGGDAERAETLNVLKNAKGFLRTELSREMSIRYVPELEFRFDQNMEQGERIQRVFNEAAAAEKERAEAAKSQSESISTVAAPGEPETQDTAEPAD